MQEFWDLYIEDAASVDSNLIGWYSFSGDFGAFSERALLDRDWWRAYDVETKESYLADMREAELDPDPAYLERLPEAFIYHRNHDTFIKAADQLLTYIREHAEELAEEFEEDKLFSPRPAMDLLNPENLAVVVKELTAFRTAVENARNQGKGFYLKVWLDY